MNMKKKISLLMALAMCGTIGGVYATWTYTESNDVADQNREIVFQLTDDVFSGSAGAYTLTVNQDLAFYFDQASEAHDSKFLFADKKTAYKNGDVEQGADHSAIQELPEDTWAFKIVFTPSADASNFIKDYGVDTWFTISDTKDTKVTATQIELNGKQVYNYDVDGDDVSVFNFPTTGYDVETSNGYKITWNNKTAEGAFEVTYTVADLKTFMVANTFVLDTVEDYNAFATAIAGATIKINVTDGVTASN